MNTNRTYHFGSCILAIVLSLVGCSVLGEDSTNIRIHNASEYNFKNVEVQPQDRLVNYGDIKNGAKTDYKVFDTAYRYAYVRLFIDDIEFIIQPIDFVGETPLGSGRFTYVLQVVDFENQILNITTEKD